MNKRSRHSTAKANVAVNRAHKRKLLNELCAQPNRATRRAPKREAFAAAKLTAEIQAQNVAGGAVLPA